MDTLEILYNLFSMVMVLSTMISMGLGLTVKQITSPLRNTRLVIMALLINFILVPGVAYALTLVIPMEGALVTGLLLVALAAGAPGLPKTAEIAKLSTAEATGLMALLVLVTTIVMPIILPMLLSGVSVTFWDIAKGMIFAILIPLGVSLFVRARWEDLAKRGQPIFAQASTYSLVVVIVLMLVLNLETLISLFGSGGLLASLILVVVYVVAGYLLGGSDSSNKWVLALAGQRSVAAAMVVATLNFGSDETVMIVAYSVVEMIVIFALSGELGKRRTKAKPA